MAAADYAEDPDRCAPPPEIELALACLRWNCLPNEYLAQPAGLMNHMEAGLNILNTFEGRKRAESWAMWAKANPQGAALLQEIERLRQEHG